MSSTEERVDPRIQRSRQRIAEATYELHREIGPAQTTISAVARRAGVQRLTVYRHFPDDLDLYRACLEHWRNLHPWPDPSPWRRVVDPEQRLRTALGAIYGFFEQVEPLFVHGAADIPKLPKLQQADAPLFEHWDQIRRVLASGWAVRGRRRAQVLAAVGLAIDFQTWLLLVRREGLSVAEAVEVAAGLVHCATLPVDC